MAIGHIKSNTIGDFTGTVTVFNSQGSTQTANATDLVRPVDWNSVHTLSFGLGGNTSNASTFGGTDVQFQGSRNITLAGNASVMSIIGPDLTPYLTTAMASNAATISNINVSAGTTSNNLSALTFSNANGISFGLNASTVTASHNGLTSQSTGAFSGSNGSFTANTLTFGSSNNIHFYTTNGSMVASYNDVDPVPAFSGSNGSFQAATLSFGNLNGLSFYTSNGSIVGSYTDAGGAGAGFSAGMSNLGATTGTSGTVASQMVFVGTGGIALSQSVNGNSATLSIYNPAQYGSFAENITLPNNSNFQRPLQSTFMVAPLFINRDLSHDWIGNLRSASFGSTTITATTSGTTFSFNQVETHRLIIYTKMTGASSLSLASLNSSTYGISHSINVGIGTASTQYTISQGLTVPCFDSNGTSTFSTAYGVSNATLNISTTHLTNWAGPFIGLSSFAGSLSAGQYYIAHNHTTSQTTQHTAALSAATYALSFGHAPIINATVRSQIGIASNITSQGPYMGNGSMTVAGGTSIATVEMSRLSMVGSNAMMHVRLGRFV